MEISFRFVQGTCFSFFSLEAAAVVFAMKADVRQLLTPLVISSIMWGQDERLQEREELFRVPGTMLRSPDVFGWESALLRSNKKPRKPDLCFATRVDILLLMQMERLAPGVIAGWE